MYLLPGMSGFQIVMLDADATMRQRQRGTEYIVIAPETWTAYGQFYRRFPPEEGYNSSFKQTFIQENDKHRPPQWL